MTATKTKAAKAVKVTKSTNGTPEADRAAAKAKEITMVDYRILKAIGNDSLTYRGIEAKTGYYANLTAALRDGYDGSLTSRGLTVEKLIDDVLHFALTAKGKKLLAK